MGILSKFILFLLCFYPFLQPMSAEAALNCFDCHGTRETRDIRPEDHPFRNPSSGGFLGNHRTHMGSAASVGTCIKCHPGSDSYASSHRDGRIKISTHMNNSPLATPYGVTTSVFLQTATPNLKSCSGVNCHFEKDSPIWGSPALDKNSSANCSICHGAPPSDGAHPSTSGLGKKHGDYLGTTTSSCSKCHSDHLAEPNPFAHATSAANRALVVLFNLLPNYGGVYGGNGSNINYPHYLPSQNPTRNGACLNIYCHSDGKKNPITGIAGAPTFSVSWSDSSDANKTQCFSCHKGRMEDNTQANCIKIGGSWDSAKGACSPDITMSNDAHHLLVGPQWIRQYPCYYCHQDTVDNNNTLGNISSMAKHVNGKPDVVIAPKWNIVGRPDSTYNASTKVCDNLYCHSDGTSDPEPVKPFAWPEKKALCNSCHGHPIGSCSTNNCHDGKLHAATSDSPAKVWPIVTNWEVGKEWMGAVPMYANEGAGTARANSHPRHVQSDYACDECHASTVKGGGGCSSCHADGIPPGSMSELSHLDGVYHVNKVKDVVFKRGGTYKADKSCANTACHKDGSDPVWGGSVGTQVICKNCHGTNGADVDTSVSVVGATTKINLTQWGTTGHGRYSSAYPVSKNPAAKFPGNNACWYCHDNSVYHNDPDNVFRLRQHSQFSQRFEGECVYCHMSRLQSECLACHDHSGSMAPQLVNMSSSHLATAKWADGSAVIRPDHRNMQEPSCMTDQATACHSSDQKTHNTGAGIWTSDQKADIKNQYVMMGVCLQCHDDDSGNKCAGCHGVKKADGSPQYTDATFTNISIPTKYALGFDGGSGLIKPKKARASSVHFGYKHYKDFINTGGWTKDASGKYLGVWKGGKFCWDCHDPHGDSNIYMIHDNVATSTDGRFGIPFTRAAVSFKKAQTGVDYAKTTAPYNGICNVCHSPESKHFRADGGDGHNSGSRCTNCHEHRFSDSHAGKQTCNTCHQSKPIPRHSGFGQPRDCIKCHAQTIGKRTDVINSQFAGNSHHVQGVELNSRHCYACHWESTSEGLIDVRHHQGYNYLNFSTVANAQVDLVLWGPGVRPKTYKLYSTAIQFLASNVSFGIISTERKEVAKVTPHCISCHSDQNNNSQPFGDCKTPRQYAWDKQSIAGRFSQVATTTWGKYATNGKKGMTKAYSAHGNAVANQGGYSPANGVDAAINNTRNGRYNVECFDCHNSHGTRVVGTTSSYMTFNGTRNGGNLKETQAGKGGYKYNYKAKANAAAGAVNPYSAGGGQCFDCHMNSAQNASITGVEGYRTPWGYQSTFGETAPVMGYVDSPSFGQALSPRMVRYGFKAMPMQGGHMKATSFLNHSTSGTNKINGLCTPCHDPHGVTPTLGAKQPYGVPLLKGTWMTSPYVEDAPPANPPGIGSEGVTPNNFIDIRATVGSEDDSQFAGLCLRCHYKKNLTDGTTHTWKN